MGYFHSSIQMYERFNLGNNLNRNKEHIRYNKRKTVGLLSVDEGAL